jgi:uncharacterized repeat protein (TIGR03803 family)
LRSASLCLAFLVLTACSKAAMTGGAPLPATPSAQSLGRQSFQASGSFASLYAFKGAPDGAFPLAPLVNVAGVFYGTTSQGGTATANGDGTVFSFAAGTETILHNFSGVPDGLFPQAGLTSANGTLYGTTPDGGANGNGSVYTIAPDGTETVVYSFGAAPDGVAPTGALVDVNGSLYGTTSAGGGTSCASDFGCGTVFKIDPSGTETVVYRFAGGSDGQFPAAGLLLLNGSLYGTTFFGGGNGCNFRGCGTVFKIDPTNGQESILYAFKGGKRDGSNPSAGLIAIKRALYGTTSEGGHGGRGTVFRVSPKGNEKVLHFFSAGADGADPEAGLVDVDGTLYGTTFAGGGRNGFGIIFAVTQDGTETILHTFSGVSDGANPAANMIAVDGSLFGTTSKGGAPDAGTIFSFAL